MSFQAKLILDDNEYNVLTVEYSFTQPVDVHNRPSGRVRGGIIDLTLESGGNNVLMEWATQDDLTRNGKIDFYRRDSTSVLKSVEFTNTFCIHLKEIFISEGAHPMVTKIRLSANMITVQNARIQNTWAGIESESSEGSSESSSPDAGGGDSYGIDF